MTVGSGFTGLNIASVNPHLGKDVVSNVALYDAATAVPEPEGYALLLAGLAVVGLLARRRQR